MGRETGIRPVDEAHQIEQPHERDQPPGAFGEDLVLFSHARSPRPAKRHSGGDRFNARAFRTGCGPFIFFRHPGPHSLVF